MSRIQSIVLIVLGVLVVAVFGGLGAAIYDTVVSYGTAGVVSPESSSSSVTAATAAPAPIERASPAVQDTGERSETTRRVEALLRELGYHVIGVRAVTDGAGDRTLAAYIRSSYTRAENTLIEVNSVVSLYVTATSPPFDRASVVIYSPEDKVIITSVVLREDVEAWLNGHIGTDQFINRLVIQPQ